MTEAAGNPPLTPRRFLFVCLFYINPTGSERRGIFTHNCSSKGGFAINGSESGWPAHQGSTGSKKFDTENLFSVIYMYPANHKEDAQFGTPSLS